MKDHQLIAGIRAREEEAMAQCMRTYSRLLWPIASAVLRNVGSDQDVEECVADAFVYLWEHPDRWESGRGSLKSWLCILARSRAIDRYRQLTRHTEIPLEEAVLADRFGMQEALEQEETRQELLTAIRGLGEPGREILIRRYYHDQKPRDIALALDLTVKQVDNALYRTKRQLREMLTGKQEGSYE